MCMYIPRRLQNGCGAILIKFLAKLPINSAGEPVKFVGDWKFERGRSHEHC